MDSHAKYFRTLEAQLRRKPSLMDRLYRATRRAYEQKVKKIPGILLRLFSDSKTKKEKEVHENFG